jgi:integrase
MSDIKEILRLKRPNLSESSITTYNSIIKNLYKKVFQKNGDIFNVEDFNDSEKVLNYLQDIPSNKRKTILAAITVLTDNEKYRNQMNEDVDKYNVEISKQEMTDNQRENWIESKEINDLLNKFENESKLIYKKKDKTIAELRIMQNYIILCLLGGKYIGPRRSLDYVNFKTKNINKSTDNYLEKNEMIFNSYKTVKSYGTQKVKIPAKLKNVLLKWIAINPTDYLLFDSNLNKMSSVKLNQTLNKLFGGRKISVNALRKSYLTEKYSEMSRKTKELEEDMTMMGSSTNVSQHYILLNAPK